MWKWIKKGLLYNPKVEKDRPNWRWDYAQGQNVLFYEHFIRVYICCREKPNEFGQTVSRIGYVDLDKDDLFNVISISKTPIIDLGELGCFDEYGQYPFCPVRIGDYIYGYHGGVTRCESIPSNSAIGLAISRDNGETFQKIGKGPILSYSLDEPFCVGSPKVRIYNGIWYMFYSAGRQWVMVDNKPEVCYKLRMATSGDGINWVKMNTDIIENKVAEDESQACGDIIFKNGKYHMFFCYRKNINFRSNKKNSYRIGYAWSLDLFHWNRQDEKAGIDVSMNETDWDGEMIAYPNIFEYNKNIYMLYLGNGVGRNGFGLAQLEGELK